MLRIAALLFAAHVCFADPACAIGSLANVSTGSSAKNNPPTVPDKRPEVAQLLEQLESSRAERGKQDELAVEQIASLAKEFSSSGRHDQRSIAAGFERCLKEKRGSLAQENLDQRLHAAAAEALGTCGDLGVKPLDWALDQKHFREQPELHRIVILALGTTRSKAALDSLYRHSRSSEPAVQAAALEALGDFSVLPERDRKEIFLVALKALLERHSLFEANNTDPILRHEYEVLAGPAITTLQRLSGEDLRDPQHWQRWWNKSKNEAWDSPSA